jgi:Protein of unknown function (DUF3370)
MRLIVLVMILPFFLAQTTPIPPQEILRPQEMRVLPGALDRTLVLNSNSPELVLKEGILLSTFPKLGMRSPNAHLNRAFSGRFDIFTHHIARGTPEDLRSLYLGLLVHNPGTKPVTVDILQAASYLSQPDAPFIDLPAVISNDAGTVFSGPGSRAMEEILRGKRQDLFPPVIQLAPGESQMIMNLPIPVKTLNPPLNGRSSLLRLRSTDKVHLASLALFAKPDGQGGERAPTIAEWQDLLRNGELSSPRDRVPTPLEQKKGNVIYGRVAGVGVGSRWVAQVTDANSRSLQIPRSGWAFSYGLSTLHRGTLGTNQVQTSRLIDRYPDTAYEAHGNYAIHYNLTFPLENPTEQEQTVVMTVETPLKREDTNVGLRFFQPLPKTTFFRGSVRFRFNDDDGLPKTRTFHLVQRRGQEGDALLTLKLRPRERRSVQFELIYPPDATPPQVITVKTL